MKESRSKLKESRSKFESAWFFIAVSAVVVVVGLLLWYAIDIAYPSLTDRANFGNLFGGINTLFAGLAFAALVFTLVLQQRALNLQRAELEDQRRDLVEQNQRLERQTFEAMLVQLLGFHHGIARDIEVRVSMNTLEGQAALRHLADELSARVNTASQSGTAKSTITVVQEAYEGFHARFRGTLDHYFRNLYHIIKFIDQSDLPEPRRYTSLVRAQLSPAELALLFYNCLSERGTKFKPLIEKYGLLEQLPQSELPIPGHKALYAPGAYG